MTRAPRPSVLHVGIGLSAFLGILGLLGPLLAPEDPLEVNLRAELLPPSSTHWLGTDADGADILSRMLSGARLSLVVGLGTVGLSLSLGTLLGLCAGYLGGWIDRLLVFVIDVLQSFPGILLPMAIAAFSPWRGPGTLILTLAIGGWVGYCRMARAQVLLLRDSDLVLAAVAVGLPTGAILRRYVLPNILAPLIVQSSFGMAGAILAEAGLSFLGVGVAPGTPSWGLMLDQGRHYLLVAPHLSIYPGAGIALLVLSFNLLGDGLRDRLDPRHARL